MGASFLEGYCNLKFVASSHTLSPVFQGTKRRVVLAAMSFLAELWAAKASFRASSSQDKRSSKAGRKVFPREG